MGLQHGLTAGLTVQAAGLTWWALVVASTGPAVTSFLMPATLWALGAGVSLVNVFILCTSTASGPMAGAASGLATTSQNAGGALGVAAIAAIAHARTTALDGSDHASAMTSGYAVALVVSAVLALGAAGLAQLAGPLHRPGSGTGV